MTSVGVSASFASGALMALILSSASCGSSGPGIPLQTGNSPGAPGPTAPALGASARIVFLHHSTGEAVWNGGVPDHVERWNSSHGTSYRLAHLNYPAATGGYPWSNYPYDYWNLWVDHGGDLRDRGELNLDDLVRDHDVIVFKHCYPVSGIEPDEPAPSVASDRKTLANYRRQYDALKARMRELPGKRFIVWTGAALTEQQTTPAQAERARQFFEWVRGTWDEPGDNIYVWDFYALETGGGLYLEPAFASGTDPHPNPSFSQAAAPFLAQRIVDVVEGRGDTGPITGK